MSEILFAFSMTLLAGLCTSIGSLIAFFSKKESKFFLSVSLGFSAGVMIYVSLVEIFQKAKDSLIFDLGEKTGNILTVVAFFGGMLLIALIDKLIPKGNNPHELSNINKDNSKNKSLMRMGLFTALALAIHNFPEGLATFVSVLQDPVLALPIVFAIALHNIPEGIAVSVPIYHATGSKKKAFLYSTLSGLTEPIGALIGWLILMPIMSETVFGIIFAMVAGIMVFISLDELLPCATEYGKHHHAIYGLVLGMIVMAVSLLLFI